jgi:hypothetical protein
MRVLLSALVLTLGVSAAQAQETSEAEIPMTFDRLAEIVIEIDPDAKKRGTVIELTLSDVPVMIIADPSADRMRAMVPIRSVDGLDAEELMRLMQANFDTALDARYAVAQGRLWGTFIHPLSPLEKDQFISSLAQTVTVALTYGQTYSSGAITFGGGDSQGIYEDILRDLLKRGEEL